MRRRLLATLGLSLLALLAMAADCKKSTDESSSSTQIEQKPTQPAASAGTKDESPAPPPAEASASGSKAAEEVADEPARRPGRPPGERNPIENNPAGILGEGKTKGEENAYQDLSLEEFTKQANKDVRIIKSQLGDYEQQVEQAGDKFDQKVVDELYDQAERRNRVQERLEELKSQSNPPQKKLEQTRKQLHELKKDWAKLRSQIEHSAQGGPAPGKAQ